MRTLLRGSLFLLVIFSLVACKKTLKPEELPGHISVANSYYTQFVIRYEKGTHATTNYRRGASIPVNTKVKLLDITAKTIKLEVENSAQPLIIKNIPKHTGKDIYQTFDDLFAKKKINLYNFNSLERRNIKNGTVAKGMRKKAVKVAIGYPPITETMNLDADTWVYWSARFNKFNVNFRNGKVSSVVD